VNNREFAIIICDKKVISIVPMKDVLSETRVCQAGADPVPKLTDA
jgi:hypothetical protein